MKFIVRKVKRLNEDVENNNENKNMNELIKELTEKVRKIEQSSNTLAMKKMKEVLGKYGLKPNSMSNILPKLDEVMLSLIIEDLEEITELVMD